MDVPGDSTIESRLSANSEKYESVANLSVSIELQRLC